MLTVSMSVTATAMPIVLSSTFYQQLGPHLGKKYNGLSNCCKCLDLGLYNVWPTGFAHVVWHSGQHAYTAVQYWGQAALEQWVVTSCHRSYAVLMLRALVMG